MKFVILSALQAGQPPTDARDRQQSGRAADPRATRIVDQAIAGMFTHERIPLSGLSHELDLDGDLLVVLALAR